MIWKLYEIQILVFIKSSWHTATLLMCVLSMSVSLLKRQGCSSNRDPMWYSHHFALLLGTLEMLVMQLQLDRISSATHIGKL